MGPKYSIVIPLKNEEGNVKELISEIEIVMNRLHTPWELICIDDGSTDGTLALLKDLTIQKPFLRVVVFDGNFGQSSGFDAGFKAANGEFTITMDGDRQNDPEDIPKMIEAMGNCDLICGHRVNRKDTVIKRVTSWLANFCRSRLCKDGVHDSGCSLKIYKTSSLRQIKMYQGMHRFLPALFVAEGFRVKEIAVNHRPRVSGKTKYNFLNRSFNTIADMLAVRWMRQRKLHYRIKKS